MSAVAAGDRLGPYEILSQLGQGGMGEVWRAKDTRLNRIVAIKVVRGVQTGQPAFRLRFEREAKAISSLNHPHICTVHDFGAANGLQFLVLEYLDGETLAVRLRRGPMRLEDFLRCAMEIADALSEAHRHGLVHRDLKPSNVMLTKSGAKVLDFGLARAVRFAPGEGAETLTQALTSEGMIVGTYPYMSSEQLQGREVDARSDIFSFGAVMYEMATGHRAFAGESTASVIAAVLEHKPAPLYQLQPNISPSLDWTVRTCLEKDPEDRWQSAHDVMLHLRRLREVPSGGASVAQPPSERRSWSRVAAAGVAGLVLGGILAGAWLRLQEPKLTVNVLRFEIAPPPRASFAVSPNASVPVIDFSVSPDGSKIAFVAEQDRVASVWVRSMSEPTARPLTGTEGGQHPFWSPEGRSIGFFAQNSLKKIDANGRSPAVPLAEVSGDPRGGAWLASGVIVYVPSNREPMLRIPATGGQPMLVFSGKVGGRWWPSPLPDGQRFIFFDRSAGGLFAASVDGTVSERLVATNWGGTYIDPGYVLYLREGVLMAHEFDPRSVATRGEPAPVAEAVGAASNSRPGFSGSHSGIVAHSSILMDPTRIVLYDRHGAIKRALSQPGHYMDPRISPDGQKVAWSRVEPGLLTQDIWVFDVDRETTTRITSHPVIDASPVWSPDSTQILYRTNKTIPINLYIRDLGTGTERAIFDRERQSLPNVGTNNPAPTDWSSDGRYVIYTGPGRTGFDVFRVALEPNATPEALARSAFNEMHAALSPDGRRLALASDESGQLEVYVQSFPEGKDRQLISVNGGFEPKWRRDGRELYFLAPSGKLMAASFSAAGEAGRPVELLTVHTPPPNPFKQNYHPSADGQRFAVNAVAEGHLSRAITVVVNSPALVK
jgi:serine/threonine protein kinase